MDTPDTSADAAGNNAALDPEDHPVVEAAPIPPQKVVIWYEWIKGDERLRGRVFLNGPRDLYTQADIENVEKLIATNLQYDTVLITGWRGLEG